MRSSLFLFLLLFACPVFLLVGEERSVTKKLLFEPTDAERTRVVPVKVYLPSTEKPAPVILFSHGLGGSREASAFLGSHWAENGFVALHMQHAGSDSAFWRSAGKAGRAGSFKKAMTMESAEARLADVSFILDQLERWNADKDHALYRRLDLEHVGMSGHSFGAITTQALMGQKKLRGQEAGDSRIDAFLALSPSISHGIDPAKSFGHITAPVLLMTGTKDEIALTPGTTAESRRKVYAGLPDGNKYQLVLKDAQHSAFSDGGRFSSGQKIAHHHPAIEEISTRFWDAYLKDDADAKRWLQSKKPEADAGLVDGDVWEWK